MLYLVGGPLQGHSLSEPAMTLVGIVSYGTTKCGIGVPGVYTNVTHYLPWIRRNLRP